MAEEQKLIFWDWSRVEDEGARLENLVAVHLLRFCHWLEDIHGESAELRYFRDVDGHEVDFMVMLRKKPWLAIEVKSGDRGLSPGLRYLLERSKFTFARQVSAQGGREQALAPIGGCPVHLMPLTRLLACLPLRRLPPQKVPEEPIPYQVADLPNLSPGLASHGSGGPFTPAYFLR